MTNSSKRKIIIVSLIALITILGGLTYLGHKQEQQKQLAKEHALYKHGFRLLEEQIAVYIKEHYSGVSKIEFTDIYNYGDSGLYVYPMFTDNHGNRTLLNDSINGAYGTSRGLYALEFHPCSKSEIIYLDNSANGSEIDVSDYQTLPDKAKVKESYITDRNFERLLKAGSIKGVEKSDKGSPDMKIVYNLKIKEK